MGEISGTTIMHSLAAEHITDLQKKDKCPMVSIFGRNGILFVFCHHAGTDAAHDLLGNKQPHCRNDGAVSTFLCSIFMRDSSTV